MTVSGEFQHGWVEGAGSEQDGGFNSLKREDELGQFIGHLSL